MATKFTDFMAELQQEAKAEGPQAIAELEYFRERYRLACRFAEARRKRGWTQKKLAKKTGLNQSEISTLESGQANPTYWTLQTLAAVLRGKIQLVIRASDLVWRSSPLSSLPRRMSVLLRGAGGCRER